MNKLLLILLAFTFVFATSCNEEEYFEDTLMNTVNPNPDFASNQDLENVLSAAYFSMKSTGNLGIVDAGRIYHTLASDLVDLKEYSSTRPKDDVRQTYLREYNNPDVDFNEYIWQSGYMVMQHANTVIDFYSENEPFPGELSGQKDRMVGEALFLRAFAHFRVATVFAAPYSSDPGAPGIILQNSQPVDAQDMKGRSTVGQVYDQIIADAQEAIQLLPEEFINGVHPEGYQVRANKDVAKFLLARVYFLMGEEFWGNAGDSYDGGQETALGLINDLIASGKYEPTDAVNEVWNQVGDYTLKANETVWSHPFWRTWRGNRTGRFFVPRFETNNNRFNRKFAMNKEIIEKIGWDNEAEAIQDDRYNAWHIRYDKNPADEAHTDPEYNGEYEDDYNIWSNKHNDRLANVPIYRSPELYLMRAAILVRQNADKGTAMADLNVLRERAGLDPLTDANALTLEDVEIEWIKELGFEGSRLMFLQAMKMDVGPGNRPGVSAVSYNHRSLYVFIPRREVELNGNIENIE